VVIDETKSDYLLIHGVNFFLVDKLGLWYSNFLENDIESKFSSNNLIYPNDLVDGERFYYAKKIHSFPSIASSAPKM